VDFCEEPKKKRGIMDRAVIVYGSVTGLTEEIAYALAGEIKHRYDVCTVNALDVKPQDINRAGTTILLIEQNAMAALSVSDYGYVLETGEIRMEGPGRELMDDERVIDAYLG